MSTLSNLLVENTDTHKRMTSFTSHKMVQSKRPMHYVTPTEDENHLHQVHTYLANKGFKRTKVEPLMGGSHEVTYEHPHGHKVELVVGQASADERVNIVQVHKKGSPKEDESVGQSITHLIKHFGN